MKLVKFVLSESLKVRLKAIDSPICNRILNLKKVDFESNSYRNFIDVSNDDRTMISFIDRNKENKLNEVLVNLKRESPCYTNIPIGTKITLSKRCFSHYHDENNNLVTGWELIPFPYVNQCRQKTVSDMGYSRVWVHEHYPTGSFNFDLIEDWEGRKNVIDSWNRDIWNPSLRIKTKAGKFIRTLFPDEFTDQQIEYFANEYQKQAICACEDGNIFKELEGESIKWAYLEDNYYKNEGTLGGSCMRYDSCQEYLDIYTLNKKHVGLMVRIEDDKVRARCLLWYPNGKNSSEKYHDRIYYINNYDNQCMEVYLKSCGFKDCYENKSFPFSISIKLDYGSNEITKFPYMDSFKYLSGRSLSTINNGGYLLENTDGSYSNRDTCADCGCSSNDLNYIHRGRYEGDYLCDSCSIYAEDIEEYVHNSNAVYSECESRNIYEQNAVYCEYDNDYASEDNVVRLVNGEYTCSDDYETSEEGDVFLPDKSDFDNYVEIQRRWYRDDNPDIYFNEEDSEWDLLENKKEENELVQSAR